MRTHSHTTSTKTDSFRRIEVITGVGRRRRWTDVDGPALRRVLEVVRSLA